MPALKQSNNLYGYNSPMNSRLDEVLVCGYCQWHQWFEEIPNNEETCQQFLAEKHHPESHEHTWAV